MRVLTPVMIACTLLLSARFAHAQSWVPPRSSPSILEIVAIDATGETPWPFGAEDVLGDGLATFDPPEPSLDIRTAYAAATVQDFFVRVYVSDANAVANGVTVYVFLDTDANAATGGSAAAASIDPALSSDPSPGGYETLIALSGSADPELYRWQAAMDAFQAAMLAPPEADAEAGQDLDPIRVGPRDHGYVQARLDLDVVGLTAQCNASIFVRSVDGTASPPGGDLDVGRAGRCVAAASNGVPDIVVPPQCSGDADCPGGGVCVGGRCRLTRGCAAEADCADGEVCADGWCVAGPGGTCTTSADCGDRICENGTCDACTSDAQCGEGLACGPDGRCFNEGGATEDPNDLVDEDEEVQGGACACRAAGGGRVPPALLVLGIGISVVLGQRRRKRRMRVKANGNPGA